MKVRCEVCGWIGTKEELVPSTFASLSCPECRGPVELLPEDVKEALGMAAVWYSPSVDPFEDERAKQKAIELMSGDAGNDLPWMR